MAITLVQSTSNNTGAALAYGSNVTAGNFLICSVGNDNGSGTVPTDTLGNTWLSIGGAAAGNPTIFYYVLNCLGGANTVTQHDAPSCVAIYEFSGIATTSAIDQVNADPSASVSITTTANGVLVFSDRDSFKAGFPTITPSAGWTTGQTMHYTAFSLNITNQDAWQVQSVAGAINNSGWTTNGTFNVNGGSVIADFFKAAGAASSIPQLMMMGMGN